MYVAKTLEIIVFKWWNFNSLPNDTIWTIPNRKFADHNENGGKILSIYLSIGTATPPREDFVQGLHR